MVEETSRSELERSIISTFIQDYSFEEVSEIKNSSNDYEEIQIKTITKGVYKGRGGFLGIICDFVKKPRLSPLFQRVFRNQSPIEKIYEGEQYLLCLANSKVYSFSIVYYKEINSIIDEIDFEYPVGEKEMTIGFDAEKSIHILIIKTKIANFLIAGLSDFNQDEEERVILSNRLEASQPFFKFKAPIHYDWSKLVGDNDRQFERICELLLQKEPNIIRIIPIGKTRAADRGRDFEVTEKVVGFNSESEIKWLVQCKYSIQSINAATISGWTDRLIAHKYDGFWLMTNNDITPNLFDQFKDIEANDKYQIKTKFWQRSDFHIKLNVHSELFGKGDIFNLE